MSIDIEHKKRETSLTDIVSQLQRTVGHRTGSLSNGDDDGNENGKK